MFKTGWFRLWVVVSTVLLMAWLAVAGYLIWGQDACYRYVTISNRDGFVADDDMRVIEHLRDEAAKREYCGRTQFSALVTLEQLAKKGVVTQVAFQWKEPRGWTFSEYEMLDFVDAKDFSANELLVRVHQNVHAARLQLMVPGVLVVAAASLVTLFLGLGIGWVRRGFRSPESRA